MSSKYSCRLCGRSVHEAATLGNYLQRVNAKGGEPILECRPNCAGDQHRGPQDAVLDAIEGNEDRPAPQQQAESSVDDCVYAHELHALNAAPPPDDEAIDLLRRFVALVPEPQLVSQGYDSPPEHATQEEHELGYALHLARAYLARKEPKG